MEWLAVVGALFAFAGLTYVATRCLGVIMAREPSVRKLFNKFGQKIFMTTGLALFFGGMYVLFLLFGPHLVAQASMADIFKDSTHRLPYLIYMAPAILIVNAILICIVREIIKVIYHW